MIIVAIDPGPHMGMATRLNTGALHQFMIHNDMLKIWNYLDELFEKGPPGVIIVERFATGGMISRDGLFTVEAQGAIFHAAWKLHCRLYTPQPAARKPFEEEARKLIGANHTKIQSHAVDAVAHLLRWEYDELHGRHGTSTLTGVAATGVAVPTGEVPVNGGSGASEDSGSGAGPRSELPTPGSEHLHPLGSEGTTAAG